MKASTIVWIMVLAVMSVAPLAKPALSQTNAIPVELNGENEFVVKMMDVIDKSGKKLTDYTELNGFNPKEQQVIFKDAGGKLKKIPAREIRKIAFIRLRQGVLTGKSQNLRVIAWNGKTANIELSYQAVRIADGYLWLDQKEFSRHFKPSDMLRAGSSEWSEKFYSFWKRKKAEDPDAFAAHFEYKNGQGAMSRKMATEYCPSCLKIEIIAIQMDPKTETIRIRCKAVFYDRYVE